MEGTLTRRSFVKWSAAAAGAASLAGFTGCAAGGAGDASGEAASKGGKWLYGGCYDNCSCNSGRCLLNVYVEDGVPLKIRTDEVEEDSIGHMQRRACPRGRARISQMLNPARIKYPMKRKGWSPDSPNGELRGLDEWERISWDEALEYVADELKKAVEKYTSRSILSFTYIDNRGINYDQVYNVLTLLGGAITPEMGTCSFGSWPMPELFITGAESEAPDYMTAMESDLHFHFGNNWMANKGGNTAYQMRVAKENGGKFIIVDPWYNQTAQAIADEWVPILPGTDTAFLLGIAYHQIENGLYDQAWLDKYCVGFDADHMPEGAPKEENFKDYVLGTYDAKPKTPEWAESICGVPAGTIRRLAEEIHASKKVDFFAGQSVTKFFAGEIFSQVFYTLAFMHGGLGTSGNYASWTGRREFLTAAPYATAGSCWSAGLNPVNPLKPPSYGMYTQTPNFSEIEDMSSWDRLETNECWQSILDGEYGRDSWPGGKKKVDIHVIYCGFTNFLNAWPDVNKGIEAFRKVDFVFGMNPFFTMSQQYCDIVLPCSTNWEKGNIAFAGNSDAVFWHDRIMEPMFESKPEGEIAVALGERLGFAAKAVDPQTPEERTLMSVAGSIYMNPDTQSFAPLITVTQEDIDELGAEGAPQEGIITFAELKEKGVYKVTRAEGDALSYMPYAAYVRDPEGSPLNTASGKFEIYCEKLAEVVNSLGFSKIEPIGKWQEVPFHGVGSRTEEFPLLLFTPHTLRRAHTVNDTVTSLREAFPQECFMSVVDAEARGIKNGDVVLMSSPFGKVLRPAKVMTGMTPGTVALQDGAWTQIDPETGIDIGGNPNVLQSFPASGQGVQTWSGTALQVEKYDGPIELLPDKHRPVVMPVGIE